MGTRADGLGQLFEHTPIHASNGCVAVRVRVEEVGVVVGVERECATCCEGGRGQDQGKNRVMDQVKDKSQEPEKIKPESKPESKPGPKPKSESKSKPESKLESRSHPNDFYLAAYPMLNNVKPLRATVRLGDYVGHAFTSSGGTARVRSCCSSDDDGAYPRQERRQRPRSQTQT